MKQYLILIYASDAGRQGQTDEEKFETYKAWGAYLSRFSRDDDFVSGSPIGSRLGTLSSGERVYGQSNQSLKSYMLLRAKSMETISARLADMPILAQEGTKVQIHELDSQKLI